MEMASLFPGSASQIYKKKPIDALIYYAPRGKFLDLCKTYFDVRCSSMVVLTQIGAPIDIEAPMVANLLHTPKAQDQVETLNAIKTAGMFENRRGLVLLPAAPAPEHRKVVPADWRLVATPTRPRRWLGWLAGTN